MTHKRRPCDPPENILNRLANSEPEMSPKEIVSLKNNLDRLAPEMSPKEILAKVLESGAVPREHVHPTRAAKKITHKRRQSEPLEKIFDRVTDSVVELTDEEILAEVLESGAVPREEANCTRSVLLQALQKFDKVTQRLQDLGHTINLKDWRVSERGYDNKCRSCGSSVRFAFVSNEICGEALDKPCHVRDQQTSH
jgi:hypothetical protein